MLPDASRVVSIAKMAKITSFMRVTKPLKAHGKKVDASSHRVRRQHVGRETIADDEKKKKERETTGLDEEESRAHVPTFIYQVTTICRTL